MQLTISINKRAFHERMLNAALALAELSDIPKFMYGSLLVANKTIISSGYNQRKTHPEQLRSARYREVGKQARSYVHAEISCASKMKRIPKGAVLYVARKDLNGKLALARPCPGCMDYIISKGIKTVIYTTPNGFAIERISKETNNESNAKVLLM